MKVQAAASLFFFSFGGIPHILLWSWPQSHMLTLRLFAFYPSARTDKELLV